MSTAPPTLLSTEPPATASLERFGPYELLMELASGGMATVYLARIADGPTGTPLVAIKRPHRHLAADKTFLTMLVDEARLASAIEHPNVAKVRELRFEGGIPFIVMDYIEGASLAELRRELSSKGRALDFRVGASIALDALAGLQAAHELKDETGRPLNIVHRDVSPHNILVSCDGRAYITDFGIAKAEDRIQTTRTHEVKGKLAYLAPERVDQRRICTVQSDVFSMGVVLWECFAGRRLFRGEEVIEVLEEVMNAPIPRLRQVGARVPAALDDVVARALSRDLAKRFPTSHAFAQAIQRAAGCDGAAAHADVARLISAVFGEVMRARREQLRRVAGPREVDGPAQAPEAAAPDAPVRSTAPGAVLEALAPPAPTDRYFVRANRGTHSTANRRTHWWSATIAALAVGAVAGVLFTVALHHQRGTENPNAPATATSAMARNAASPMRSIVLPLPFFSTLVTLDDSSQSFDPAADVATFEVAAQLGTRHHVIAVASDGARADGYVVEQRGLAHVEGAGYSFAFPQAIGADDSTPAEVSRPSFPVGTVHNGFTKLR